MSMVVVLLPVVAVWRVACGEEQFRCHESGLCISSEWTCDGNKECDDWSDELNCGESVSQSVNECVDLNYTVHAGGD